MSNNAESTESGAHTPGVARVVADGDLEEIRTILGDRERIRYEGVIRPGIKIPLASCSAEQKKVYETMLADKYLFGDIETAMLKLEPQQSKKKSCLRPSNCDYFTVRENDFKSPDNARHILENYADEDGHVRRIPIWFPLGELHMVIPHNFRAFSKGGIRAYSFYEGSELMCKHVPKDIKTPNKDDWKIRPCEETSCAAYKSKACRFGGIFKVNVPGVRGMGQVIIPTNSWYGLGDAIANLNMVREVYGKFNGLFQGKPFLELCKVQEEVKVPGGQKQKQWIPTILPTVDMMELAQHCDPASIKARATSAHSLLGNSLPPIEDTEEGKHDEATTYLEGLTFSMGLSMEQVKSYVERDFTSVSGVAFVDMSVDEIRNVCTEIHARKKADKAEFIQYVCDVHSEAVAQ
ncbi:hypothetical protein KAR91_37195 [Candidatus Pacearchaeota archaeon]|nr:hypothetical protein [Candidatus Pacearchaeota archaeon]